MSEGFPSVREACALAQLRGQGRQRRESIGWESSPRFDKGPPLQSCVALGKDLNLWETQFSHLKTKLDDRSVD